MTSILLYILGNIRAKVPASFGCVRPRDRVLGNIIREAPIRLGVPG